MTIKKKTIIAILLCLLLGGGIVTYYTVSASTSPKPVHTIVIDAGHGGVDVKKGQDVF